MHLSDKLFKAVSILVDISEEAQKKRKSLNFAIDEKSYAKEFCTVKACTSRQSGHTTTLIRLLARFPKAMVLTPNVEMTRKIHEKFKTAKFYSSDVNFLSIGQIIRGFDPDAIIVDCASLLSNSAIDKIYNEYYCQCLRKKSFFFIFLE